MPRRCQRKSNARGRESGHKHRAPGEDAKKQTLEAQRQATNPPNAPPKFINGGPEAGHKHRGHAGKTKKQTLEAQRLATNPPNAPQKFNDRGPQVGHKHRGHAGKTKKQSLEARGLAANAGDKPGRQRRASIRDPTAGYEGVLLWRWRTPSMDAVWPRRCARLAAAPPYAAAALLFVDLSAVAACSFGGGASVCGCGASVCRRGVARCLAAAVCWFGGGASVCGCRRLAVRFGRGGVLFFGCGASVCAPRRLRLCPWSLRLCPRRLCLWPWRCPSFGRGGVLALLALAAAACSFGCGAPSTAAAPLFAAPFATAATLFVGVAFWRRRAPLAAVPFRGCDASVCSSFCGCGDSVCRGGFWLRRRGPGAVAPSLWPEVPLFVFVKIPFWSRRCLPHALTSVPHLRSRFLLSLSLSLISVLYREAFPPKTTI